MGTKEILFRNLHKCLSQLYSADVDCSRQILTTKVDPRAVRVNPYPADHDYCRF